jgi:hypothetical protein
MLRVSHLVFGFVLLVASAGIVAAQEPLALEIRDGQVTIKAQNVPLRTILTEWARIGGTSVVGAERVSAAPVTIELTEVPERQALDVLLRNVSGYLLALRPTGAQGVSAYNRILIMPPSAAPRALPQPAAGIAPRLPQTNVDTDDDDDPPEPVFEGPAGPPRPAGPALRLPNVTGQNVATPARLPVPDTAAPVPPQPAGVVVTPGNPFGVPAGSSTRPGTITPTPQQQPGQRQPPE